MISAERSPLRLADKAARFWAALRNNIKDLARCDNLTPMGTWGENEKPNQLFRTKRSRVNHTALQPRS